jgi:two-component system phosphate regulon sensor histidine kinase PhoR
MDGWWTPLIVVAALLAVAWFWGWVYRPLLQVRRLVRDLAEGRDSAGFVARGALGLEGIITDLDKISDRLQGLSFKAEREKYNLRTILGSVNEGVVITDPEGIIRLANRSFLEMFGLPTFPIGQTFMETTRLPEVARAAEETFAEAGGRSLEIRRTSSEFPGGRIFAVNFAPIVEGASGERSGVVTVFYDLSKVRRLETVRTEFITNLSHELRTPLSILAGYLETIEDPAMLRGAEGKEVLQVLQRNCERLTGLVNDLLELSRIESGRVDLNVVARKPKEILEEVRDDWKRAFAGKRVKVELECERGLPEVSADPLRTGQIFSNLMDNALRFAPQGSQVRIGARSAGAMVEFYVADEGEGIPPDKLERIFERFFRVDEGRTRDRGGTGLGLSIVKHLVQLHGGEVRAESVPENGTTIFFTKRPSASP